MAEPLKTYVFRTRHKGLRNVWIEVAKPKADVMFEDHGMLVSFFPFTARARAWIRWHVREDLDQTGAINVEPRYVLAILCGMREADLEVIR